MSGAAQRAAGERSAGAPAPRRHSARSSPEPSRARLLAAEVLGAEPSAARLAALRREPTLVVIDPGLAGTRRGQLLLAITTSLLARLFDFVGSIDLVVPETARVALSLPGLRRRAALAGGVAASLRALRPPRRGRFDLRLGAVRGPYARAIAIGRPPVVPADEIVFVDGAAWEAVVGPAPAQAPFSIPDDEPGGVVNPFGPLLASAWGVAEAAKSFFRALSGGGGAARFAALPHPIRWDLWTHQRNVASPGPALRQPVELPRTAFAGLGALGSAAALAFAQLASTGPLELVDDDRVDASNLERLVTAFASDVGRRKIDVARRALGARPLARIAGRYGASLPRGARAATILAGVDSAAARRAITRHLPYAIYHGGTQGAELLVSRHVGFEGACLECLYPERPGDGAPRACGPAGLAEAPVATIGFVSAFCGFLMAAELVKDRLAPQRRHPLDTGRPVFRLDLLAAAPGPECVEAYVPRRDCFCRREDVQREIAARRRGRAA